MLWKIQKLVNRSAAVTTISNFVATEIRKNLKLDARPLQVIYNGNCLDESLQDKKPLLNVTGKFFFSIGIISEKKNFHSLVPLLTEFKDHSLVIAGKNSGKYARKIYADALALGVQERLLMPGIVTDAEKLWLYRNCEAFLFPSLTEGFGFPVVEAMSLGKPTFISRHTSLPEIGGVEAFYFDDFESGSMARVIKNGLQHFDESRSQRSIEWANQFTWENAARRYQELYRGLQ
jgi:glycosyltransferase involved in cell wall biosynthesis